MPGTAAAQSAVSVSARYNARVAHVETVGTLFNDQQEVGGASGVLVGDSFVLTNSHVIPREGNYRTLAVTVRLKSRLFAPHAVKHIQRDQDRDLALLELSTPVSDAGSIGCPMSVIAEAAQAPVGTPLFIMGFPLNQDQSISGGIISNHDAGNGRWQTDTIINPGNSGGPAFDPSGALVGIAVGGATKWNSGGDEITVTGVNFIIPTSVVRTSPLYETIMGMPPQRRCWMEVAQGDVAPLADSDLPPLLNRDYFVSETKDDHPVIFDSHSRDYKRTFEAEPGYRITGCTWSGVSENHHSDLVCNIQSGGRSAEFTFRLTSGPAVDRWRGWLAGTVTLAQERAR